MASLRPPPASPGAMLLTCAVGGLGGWLAATAGIPLPWVLGSMAAVATLRLLGPGAAQPLPFRRAAQVTIGTALGLGFTPAVLREVLSLGHWMVLGSAFAIGLTMLFAGLMQRMARIDGPTAIYAVAVGASAEMALQAQQAGADGAQVASAHAIRIVLVVTLASVVAHFSGELATLLRTAALPTISPLQGVMFAVLAPLCGWAANRVGMPNGWLLGPLTMAAVFAALGTGGRMFPLALIAAQVLIGWSLGQHMTRQFFARSPRMIACAALVTLGMLALCLGVAGAIGATGRISLLTAFLAIAPGGTAEMAIIAKTYGIGAPVVTAFHFFRVVSTVLSIRWVARTVVRIGWVRAAPPAH